MGFANSMDYRALSEAEVARWVAQWNDSGLLSWDMFQYVGLLLLAAVPFVFAYWMAGMAIVSKRYRDLIRSGGNGMSMPAFAFAWLVAATILNDIFFTILFKGPLWAAVYHYAGVNVALEFEMAASLVRASAILFGAWS